MNTLGDLTVILNFILLFLVVIAISLYLQRGIIDLQFLIFFVAILLLLPVIIFENVLYVDITYDMYDLHYNTIFMRFLFALGIISYFVYNLHLLTIEDMPTIPVTITGIITGFAIGAMIVSANVNSGLPQPIYYQPILGGRLFIFSLMAFNIIGATGFLNSILFKPYEKVKRKVSFLDGVGIALFFLSPVVIYIARITSWVVIPVNGIFLITEVSFCFHLSNYIISDDNFGYPIHPDLISLSIIDVENDVVIAGYSSINDPNFNKLQGMTMIAVDSIIKEVFETSEREISDKYTLDYGDTIIIQNENYLMVGLFHGKGKKIGKFVLEMLLDGYVENINKDTTIEFCGFVNKYLRTFTKKKVEITAEDIYN